MAGADGATGLLREYLEMAIQVASLFHLDQQSVWSKIMICELGAWQIAHTATGSSMLLFPTGPTWCVTDLGHEFSEQDSFDKAVAWAMEIITQKIN